MSAAEIPALLRPQPGPATLKVTRWSGQRLGRLRGDDAGQPRTIGESWEFSTLPGSESAALGRPLGAVLAGPLPFLAKLIDTALPLSVQVHPGDRPDPDHPGALLPGKEEAWAILDADPGARLWAGLRPGVTRDALARAAADGSIVTCLEEHVAEPGLVVLVPAGVVHAIGAGILLAEIQQPSDTTYRLYDYGSGRPLHVDAALATIDLMAQPQVWRPHQPPARVAGEHVRLELLGPGQHRRPVADPTLLIGLRGRAHAYAPAIDLPLATGDLLLAVRGPLTLDIPTDALVVLGQVDP